MKLGNSTAQTHAVWSEIIISDNYQVWLDILTAMNTKVDWDSQPFPSYTTTNRDLISASNGMMIYNTTTWELNQYIGWAWSAVSAWSTQADGSITVAWKWEWATVAEQWTASSTWWAWPLTVMNENLVKASSWAWDENKIAVLEADWKFADWFQNISEANWTTLTDWSDASSLHLHDYNAKTHIFTSDVTIASSITETTISTFSLAWWNLSTNNIIEWKIFFDTFWLENTNTCTYRLKYWATTIATLVIDNNIWWSVLWAWTIDYAIMWSWATWTQNGSIAVNVWNWLIVDTAVDTQTATTSVSWTATEDSTWALNIVVTAQMSASSANDKITATSGYAKLII